MFFNVANKYYSNIEYLRTETLLDAYDAISKYQMLASDKILDQFIQQQYKVSLKNMCIDLLLNLSFYKNNEGNLVLLFKNPKHDMIARLITYGNGAIPGSQILQVALSD